MAMMLPDNLIWIMEKLGLEWPDIDEDEVRKAADLTREFRKDLEACLQAVDRKIVVDMGDAMRGKAGPAYTNAWNSNRSSNVQTLVDFMDPAATGIDISAEFILGMKVKVIAEIAITLAQLIPLLAAGPFGAGGAALLIIAKKKLVDIAVDIAIEQALEQIIPMVVEPLVEQLPVVLDAILDAPLVEDAAGEVNEYYASIETLQQCSADMEQCGMDLATITSQYVTDLGNLDFGGNA